MRKRFIYIVVGIIFLGILASGVMAFKNEPLGFKGLEWGKRPTPDMIKIVEDYARRGFIKPSDKLALGGAMLTRIIYMFLVVGFHEKFFAVRLEFDSERSYNILVNICKEKFGEPDQKKILKELIWNGERVTIVLDYNDITKEGIMVIGNNSLSVEYEKEKRRQQAKEAEKDW